MEVDEGIAAGRVLANRFVVGARLGAGGMGVVYEAHDQKEQRLVALKAIHARHVADRTYIERLKREGRALVQLDHPNVVRVYDVAQDEGLWFLVMERLVGRTLHERLQEGRLPADEALFVLDQMLGALGAAHARGIIHRDLKPQNVFLAETATGPVVKLFDFGIVKFLTEGASRHLTRTGMVMGTPEYLAPEQALGEKVDARSDLYAAGCVAYEMLVGNPPFWGAPAIEVMTAHVSAPPPPLAMLRPELPDVGRLDGLVRRALEKAPGARYQDAEEMRAAVARVRALVGDGGASAGRSADAAAGPGVTLPRRAPAGAAVTTPPAVAAPKTPSTVAASKTPPPVAATRIPPPATIPARPATPISRRWVVISALLGAIVAALVGYFLFVR